MASVDPLTGFFTVDAGTAQELERRRRQGGLDMSSTLTTVGVKVLDMRRIIPNDSTRSQSLPAQPIIKSTKFKSKHGTDKKKNDNNLLTVATIDNNNPDYLFEIQVFTNHGIWPISKKLSEIINLTNSLCQSHTLDHKIIKKLPQFPYTLNLPIAHTNATNLNMSNPNETSLAITAGGGGGGVAENNEDLQFEITRAESSIFDCLSSLEILLLNNEHQKYYIFKNIIFSHLEEYLTAIISVKRVFICKTCLDWFYVPKSIRKFCKNIENSLHKPTQSGNLGTLQIDASKEYLLNNNNGGNTYKLRCRKRFCVLHHDYTISFYHSEQALHMNNQPSINTIDLKNVKRFIPHFGINESGKTLFCIETYNANSLRNTMDMDYGNNNINISISNGNSNFIQGGGNFGSIGGMGGVGMNNFNNMNMGSTTKWIFECGNHNTHHQWTDAIARMINHRNTFSNHFLTYFSNNPTSQSLSRSVVQPFSRQVTVNFGDRSSSSLLDLEQQQQQQLQMQQQQQQQQQLQEQGSLAMSTLNGGDGGGNGTLGNSNTSSIVNSVTASPNANEDKDKSTHVTATSRINIIAPTGGGMNMMQLYETFQQLEALRESEKKLLEEKQEKEDKINELETKNEELETKVEEMDAKFEELNTEKQRQNNEISRLKLQLNDRINEIYKFKEMNESLTMQQNELYTEIENLTQMHNEALLQAKLKAKQVSNMIEKRETFYKLKNQKNSKMREQIEYYQCTSEIIKGTLYKFEGKTMTSLKIDSKKDGKIRHVTYVPNGKLLIYSNKKNSPESKQMKIDSIVTTGTIIEQRIAPKYKAKWFIVCSHDRVILFATPNKDEFRRWFNAISTSLDSIENYKKNSRLNLSINDSNNNGKLAKSPSMTYDDYTGKRRSNKFHHNYGQKPNNSSDKPHVRSASIGSAGIASPDKVGLGLNIDKTKNGKNNNNSNNNNNNINNKSRSEYKNGIENNSNDIMNDNICDSDQETAATTQSLPGQAVSPRSNSAKTGDFPNQRKGYQSEDNIIHHSKSGGNLTDDDGDGNGKDDGDDDDVDDLEMAMESKAFKRARASLLDLTQLDPNHNELYRKSMNRLKRRNSAYLTSSLPAVGGGGIRPLNRNISSPLSLLNVGSGSASGGGVGVGNINNFNYNNLAPGGFHSRNNSGSNLEIQTTGTPTGSVTGTADEQDLSFATHGGGGVEPCPSYNTNTNPNTSINLGAANMMQMGMNMNMNMNMNPNMNSNMHSNMNNNMNNMNNNINMSMGMVNVNNAEPISRANSNSMRFQMDAYDIVHQNKRRESTNINIYNGKKSRKSSIASSVSSLNSKENIDTNEI